MMVIALQKSISRSDGLHLDYSTKGGGTNTTPSGRHLLGIHNCIKNRYAHDNLDCFLSQF